MRLVLTIEKTIGNLCFGGRNFCVTSLEGLLVLLSGVGEWKLHRTLQYIPGCSVSLPSGMTHKGNHLIYRSKGQFISHLSLFARRNDTNAEDI